MSDFQIFLLALVPILLIVAGFLVFWYDASDRRSSLSYGRRSIILSLVGGFLMTAGVVATILGTTQFLAVLFLPAAVFVTILFKRRYYRAEQQSLMWVLLTAAERGIPLHTAAQSFAGENNRVLGNRAAQLADYLEAGLPLGLSLRRSGFYVDPAVSLAADLGYQTDTLGPALRQVLERSTELEAVTIPMASRLVYLGITVINTLIVLSFLMLRIMPVFERMHSEFGAPLPPSTKRLLAITQSDSVEFYLAAAFVGIGLFGLLFGLSSAFGALQRAPVVRWLWWRVDCSLVMRWLATGVRQQRPILEMLRLLAGYFPQAAMRRSLELAARRIEQGMHWCDSLLRTGLIRQSESAVFKAAERAGNLQWALQEMSDSAVRRWAYKLRVWITVLFPVLLIVVASGVLAVVLAFFTPLISLIHGQL